MEILPRIAKNLGSAMDALEPHQSKYEERLYEKIEPGMIKHDVGTF